MRWYAKVVPPQPREGDIRGHNDFLWLPKTIDGETRWFEYAMWLETYKYVDSGNGVGFKWVPTKWKSL